MQGGTLYVYRECRVGDAARNSPRQRTGTMSSLISVTTSRRVHGGHFHNNVRQQAEGTSFTWTIEINGIAHHFLLGRAASAARMVGMTAWSWETAARCLVSSSGKNLAI